MSDDLAADTFAVTSNPNPTDHMTEPTHETNTPDETPTEAVPAPMTPMQRALADHAHFEPLPDRAQTVATINDLLGEGTAQRLHADWLREVATQYQID